MKKKWIIFLIFFSFQNYVFSKINICDDLMKEEGYQTKKYLSTKYYLNYFFSEKNLSLKQLQEADINGYVDVPMLNGTIKDCFSLRINGDDFFKNAEVYCNGKLFFKGNLRSTNFFENDYLYDENGVAYKIKKNNRLFRESQAFCQSGDFTFFAPGANFESIKYVKIKVYVPELNLWFYGLGSKNIYYKGFKPSFQF